MEGTARRRAHVGEHPDSLVPQVGRPRGRPRSRASPVTWARLVAAARATKKTVAIQAQRYEGYTVLINALIESAGGHVIENPGAGADDLRLGVDSPAGVRAASIIRSIATGGVGGPSLSNADEEAARTLFQGSDGGFMVNWPYVWRAADAGIEDGSLTKDVVADIGWARYPRSVDGTAESPAARRDRSRRRPLVQARGSRVRRRALHHVREEPDLLLPPRRQSGRAHRRLLRPQGAQGLPDGAAPARVAQGVRATAPDRVLRRRVLRAAA